MRVSDDELARMIENEEHIGDRRIASCLRELRRAREEVKRQLSDPNLYRHSDSYIATHVDAAVRREE